MEPRATSSPATASHLELGASLAAGGGVRGTGGSVGVAQLEASCQLPAIPGRWLQMVVAFVSWWTIGIDL